MVIQVIYLRDYEISIHDSIVATIKVYNDKSKTSYAALPTIAEIREALGESATGETVREIHLSNCFSDCDSLVIAPDIPDGVTNMSGCFLGCSSLNVAPTIPNGVTSMARCFYGCDSLITAPIIPNSVINLGGCFSHCWLLNNAPDIPSSVTTMNECFTNCTSLRTAPDIPNSVTHMKYCFAGCTVLDTAPTIPNSVTNMAGCFCDCTELTGKITINANPSTYSSCMEGTKKNIVLVGSSAQLQNIANTATNNNVYVWSLSINVSVERQENDFSKANVSVIINRFRNNNESVSLTFTINSVESTPVQVTMDTATKTYNSVLSITPTSIVELSVIAEDSYGKSAPKSITLPIPFYTIDFQAGGKEVAVGAPANDDTTNRPYGLFKCGMDLIVTRLIGEIKMWAGDTVPYGWLLCDGSEVSKTAYPYLYEAIGDLWGTPNSSSNFKLPNLTGRVPVGYNAADTDTTETFGQVGATGGARGAWYHTHTIGSSGAHYHASQGRTEGSGTGANIFESYNGASKTRSVNVPRTGTNGNHTHSPGSSGSAGNKLAADKANMPPYAVVKYIICAF